MALASHTISQLSPALAPQDPILVPAPSSQDPNPSPALRSQDPNSLPAPNSQVPNPVPALRSQDPIPVPAFRTFLVPVHKVTQFGNLLKDAGHNIDFEHALDLILDPINDFEHALALIVGPMVDFVGSSDKGALVPASYKDIAVSKLVRVANNVDLMRASTALRRSGLSLKLVTAKLSIRTFEFVGGGRNH